MNATLYGVGLGPGDTALITPAAVRAIENASVIAHMHAATRKPSQGMARTLADAWVQTEAHEISIAVDMKASLQVRREAYDVGVKEIEAALASGNDVAFLCEGDPLTYGSLIHVVERLAPKFNVRIVPGVSSVQAAAAATGLALACDDAPYSVVPATAGPAALALALGGGGGVAVIKIASRLDALKSIARAKGRLQSAKLVSFASTPDEKVEALSEATSAPYFSLALFPPPQHGNALSPQNVAVVVLNRAGLATAERLKAAFKGAELFARFDLDTADRIFDNTFGNTGDTLRALFRQGRPIVAVASAGIVVRTLAGELSDKTAEPPVVAISTDGAHSVPLLGGHHGANGLARACANALGGQAAITTASDGALGVALDAPPAGWHVANPQAVRGVASEMLNGNAVRLEVEAGSAKWISACGANFDKGNGKGNGNGKGKHGIRISPREVDLAEKTLLLHPPVLALGVGCERGCEAGELYTLAMHTLATENLSPLAVACVCSLDVKSDEAAVLELAARLGVPARFFASAELEAETARLANPSDVVFAEVGCHGVSEAAALAAVGADGTLLVEKQKSPRATCAIGLSPIDLNPPAIGRGRGRLFIVGTGPGQPSWRTPEAVRILSEVSDVVGYGLYLDLIADLIEGKTRHTSELAQEEARVRLSLELAASGLDVALVSSGDPGIYAMAALAYELLDRENRSDWNRLAVQVVPGISAFQAAAAKIGAPMGHDFCLISLSDLLTPWDVIERRLKAAAVGGFAVAFYNPVSKRRTHQLETARDLLLAERPADTPVVLARNLGREGESVRVVELSKLSANDADMLTLVLVGGEDTRAVTRGENTFVYTPRGYGGKMDAAQKKQNARKKEQKP